MTSRVLIFAAWAICAGTTHAQITVADKVKASATATKPDALGIQIVTITLDIEKGCHIYANPVNHNHDFLNANATRVKINAKVKPQVDLKYAAGKTRSDGRDRYDIYENVVTIQATVSRAPKDTSPLQISVHVQGGGVDRGV